FAGETEEELLTLKRMIEAGQMTPVMDGVFPPEDAAEAHRRVENEERLGAVVIRMGD
ncbi:MAG: zinc-binding dehydrogenase, partial [Pseudomonadales bacterium]|nr:zinc-binding dehydrogenase [Pseudomonadales bacterium]